MSTPSIDETCRQVYNKNIEVLLLRNHKLDCQLENANNQIDRLIKCVTGKHAPMLKEKYELELKLLNSNRENLKLFNDFNKLRVENTELSAENVSLKTELKELNPILITNKSCIENLKSIIAKQHLDISTLRKSNEELNCHLSYLRIEYIQSTSSTEYCKQQLNNSEDQIKHLVKLNDESELTINHLYEKLAKLNVELSQTKSKCSKVQVDALKENRVLLQKLESSNHSSVTIQSCIEDSNNNKTDTQNLSTHNKDLIDDLKGELYRTKLNLSEHEKEFNKIKKENAELVSKCLVLQRNLQQNEFYMEQLEHIRKQLSDQVESLKLSEIKTYTDLIKANGKLECLETEIKIRDDENALVNDLITKLRKQFSYLEEINQKCKKELHCKDQQILQLQNEKQELFMKNNWIICELEKTKEKDFVIEVQREKLTLNENTIVSLKCKINELNEELSEKDRIIVNIRNDVKEKNDEIGRYDSVLNQYKSMVVEGGKKIKELHDSVTEATRRESEVNDNLRILKEEIRERDFKLNQALGHLNKLTLQLFEANKQLECKTSEVKNKENCIFNLQHKIENIEDVYRMYLEGNTDDRKAELQQTDSLKLPVYFKNPLAFEEELFNIFLHKIKFNEFKIAADLKLTNFEGRINNFIENVKTNSFNVKEVEELRVLLKLKDLDMSEKVKKFERTNKTLLHQVKEHMKGRNTAENRLKDLQEKIDFLVEKNNLINLSLVAKDCQIDILQKLLTSLEGKNNQLRLDSSKNDLCKNCPNPNDICAEVLYYQRKCLWLLDTNQKLQNDLKDAQTKQTQQVKENEESKKHDSKDFKTLNSRYESVCLERELKDEELLEMEENSEYNNNFEIHLQEDVELAGSNEEIQTISTDFHGKTIGIGKLEEYEQINLTLKSKLDVCQSEIDTLKAESRFLRRLCNDLKLVVNTYSDQNQKHEKELSNFTQKKVQFSSLPTMSPDSLTVDKAMVRSLLAQHKAILSQSPCIEFEACLTSLRSEIALLKGQILNMG